MRQQRQLRKGRLPALMRWCVECQQADGNEVLAATKPAGIGSLLKNFGVQRKIILGDAKNPENGGEKENGGE